jgi:hypothetical protein
MLFLFGLLALPACSLAEKPPAPGQVIAQSLASSVQLFAERQDGKRRAGSGVALSVDGDGRTLILTAAHLFEPPGQQAVFVHLPGRPEQVEAEILTIDPDLDVAVLGASGLEVQPVELKASARLGDNVWVVSFPWGRRGTVVNGFVSQIASDQENAVVPVEGPVSLIDAAVSYGTSGGGIFDSQSGGLIGIVRGYRTARLPLPGPDGATLDLPIAGETTVIPTSEILCLLDSAQLAGQVAPGGPPCHGT